jgi:hypothetical protein
MGLDIKDRALNCMLHFIFMPPPLIIGDPYCHAIANYARDGPVFKVRDGGKRIGMDDLMMQIINESMTTGFHYLISV